MDYADVQTHCEVSFLSVVFAILTVIVSVIILAITPVTFASICIVVLIGVCCGLVGVVDARAFSGCGTLIIAWIVLSLVSGGFISGLLLALLYIISFFTATFAAAKKIDESAINKYENQKHYRTKKYYRHRRKKYHKNYRYSQR